jgi:formate dehydrogenase
VAVFEDLGVQQNRHSTLVSYLNRLIWVLTGNFGKKGAQYIPSPFVSIIGDQRQSVEPRETMRSPVANARIITGLVPGNVIAEEILTDHADRYRAMIVESSNPAHSLADSQRMKKALEELEFLVVIDVAMSETARLADYILPTPTQYEKWEATFFNFDFPKNCFHLRRPLLDPPKGVLPEPEIHARLVEALGALPHEEIETLKEALSEGRPQFGAAFMAATQRNPKLGDVFSVALYRALGPALPDGAASAAVLWGAATMCFLRYPESVRRAGFANGDELFNAVLASPSGLIFSVDDYDESWNRIGIKGGKINVAIPELCDELTKLASETPLTTTGDYPFLLSAGERRSFTANTIFRNPEWRRKDRSGSLRISPTDAERLGLIEGDLARVTTKRAVVKVPVEITDRMQSGHVSLPNGLGVDYSGVDLETTPIGVAPNDLTAGEDRDWLAGTPWHKTVLARVEAV